MLEILVAHISVYKIVLISNFLSSFNLKLKSCSESTGYFRPNSNKDIFNCKNLGDSKTYEFFSSVMSIWFDVKTFFSKYVGERKIVGLDLF